jgi:hypothetical protein
MAKDTHDHGAAVYFAAEYRTPRRAIALKHGWLAAILLDHLHSLEGAFAKERIKHGGRLWFYRSRDDLMAYLGVGRDAYEAAMRRLEVAGYVCRKNMKGHAPRPVNHWSVNLAPMAENPPSHSSDGGKPAITMEENPPSLGDTPLPKRTNPAPQLELQTQNTPKVPADVQAIWSHYLQALGKTKRCKLSGKFGNTRLSRLAGIKAWLKQETDEGPNTVEKAKHLIDGLSQSEHHRQQGYDCISYALRPNNEKRFLAHLTASQGHGSSDTVNADAWLKGLGLK